MKILITGSEGFVGEEVNNYLKQRSEVKKIFCTDQFATKRNYYFKCNLNNYKKLNMIIKKLKPDIVIHCASIILDETDTKKIWATNYYATKNLIDVCNDIKVKKFIFLSTFSIFERNYKKKIIEKTIPSYKTEYGKSKFFTEKYLINCNFKNQILILRCPIIIGRKRGYRFKVLYSLIRDNYNIPLLGNGENKLSFIHVNDLNNAIYIYIKKKINIKRLVCNICADDFIKFKNIIKYLIKEFESKSKIIFLPKFISSIIFDVCVYLKLIPYTSYHKKIFFYNVMLSNKKLKKYLKWKPKIKTLAMFKENFQYFLNTRYVTSKTNKYSLSKKDAQEGLINPIKKNT